VECLMKKEVAVVCSDVVFRTYLLT